MRVGWVEIVVVLGLLLMLFGAKRLPELARAIGRSLKEFKKGAREIMDDTRGDGKKKNKGSGAK